MRAYLLLAATIPLALGAPASSLTAKRIGELWGASLNATVVQAIIEEEAARLGLSVKEHSATCEGIADKLKFTDAEMREIKGEVEEGVKRAGAIVFNKTEEILSVLKDRAPRLREVLEKRLDLVQTYYAQVDETFQEFIREAAEAILEEIVKRSRSESIEFTDPIEYVAKLKKVIKSIRTEYSGLPQETKKALDRSLCLTTSLHILASRDGAVADLVKEDERLETISKIFGKEVNAANALAIIGEQAESFNVSVREHFENCADINSANTYNETDLEVLREEYKEAEKSGGPFVFNKTEDIMVVLKERAPKTHKVVAEQLARFHARISKLDIEAQKFVRHVEEESWEALVLQSQTSENREGSLKSSNKELVAAYRKLMTEYLLLPQQSRDSIGNNFCIWTSIRIYKMEKSIMFVLLLIEAEAEKLEEIDSKN